jgi:lipopolysaccharide/colanic/teichoic acid biosynthesis glycosyltransferase
MFETPAPHSAPDSFASGSAAYQRPARIQRVPDALTDARRPIELVVDADIAPRTVTPPELTPRPRSDQVVRVLNIAIAGTALVILSPVMLLVALAIRLSSPGPVFYGQTRVGQDRRRRASQSSVFDRRACDLGGRVFRIYKFRTMRIDAERRGVQWATKNDPRVTRLGGFLRKCRLDELPQVFNILRGDMSWVGPRPEQPHLVNHYTEQHHVRFAVRPGLTGWWQIRRDGIRQIFEDAELNIYYVEHMSPLLDLKIVLLTPWALVHGGSVPTAVQEFGHPIPDSGRSKA